MDKFKIIEHTADIGIEAYGENLNELFENAAYGMFSIIAYPGKVEEKETAEIKILQPTLEDLLHSWLEELLFRESTEEILFSKFIVRIYDYAEISLDSLEERFSLIGKAFGEKINPKKHRLKTEIKAATYYQLKIEHYTISDKRSAFKARVIFDV